MYHTTINSSKFVTLFWSLSKPVLKRLLRHSSFGVLYVVGSFSWFLTPFLPLLTHLSIGRVAAPIRSSTGLDGIVHRAGSRVFSAGLLVCYTWSAFALIQSWWIACGKSDGGVNFSHAFCLVYFVMVLWTKMAFRPRTNFIRDPWTRRRIPRSRRVYSLGARRGVSKGVQDGRKAVSGVARPQGVGGEGMAGPGDTSRSTWPPLAVRPQSIAWHSDLKRVTFRILKAAATFVGLSLYKLETTSS